MNKKLHFLLLCLLLIIIVYLCKDKLFNLIEPFSQVIIKPDKAKLNPKETTFSVLTYNTDLDSGYTQASICSDDSSWRNGDKKCLNYSLTGSNCEDIGDDGRLAFDACKVACDNCNTYTEIKRRLPSPIEDVVDEPSYAQFEGVEGDDFGGIGGVDIREILGKLDDLKSKMDLIILDGAGGATPSTSPPVVIAEPVVPGVPVVPGGGGGAEAPPVAVASSVRTGYCTGNADTRQDIVCPQDTHIDIHNKYNTRGNDIPSCCYSIGYCSGNTSPNVEDVSCDEGYSDKPGKAEIEGRLPEDCCDRDQEPAPAPDASPALDASPDASPAPSPTPSPEPETKAWKIIKIILIILAILIPLIFIGIVINYYFEYKKIDSAGRSDLTESLL